MHTRPPDVDKFHPNRQLSSTFNYSRVFPSLMVGLSLLIYNIPSCYRTIVSMSQSVLSSHWSFPFPPLRSMNFSEPRDWAFLYMSVPLSLTLENILKSQTWDPLQLFFFLYPSRFPIYFFPHYSIFLNTKDGQCIPRIFLCPESNYLLICPYFDPPSTTVMNFSKSQLRASLYMSSSLSPTLTDISMLKM